MSERFIYESFGHTIGSHRLVLILVRPFDLKLKSNQMGNWIFLVLKSLLKTTKSSFIQINHFD